MYSRRNANQVSSGVFLIGLALLIANILPWWPGIMYVIGAAAIAQGLAEGRGWYALQGGLWTIGIGLLFTFHFSLPLLFILLGISVMLGQSRRGPRHREKAKNDDLYEQDADDGQEREEPYHYELGDDGEMVKVKNDEKRFEAGKPR
jgi:hypothetical protein